jgi:hypothetical protein
MTARIRRKARIVDVLATRDDARSGDRAGSYVVAQCDAFDGRR